MDKYEYKVRADEIKELISKGEYVQAAEIADTIDWRRVKSIMMLCTISDLYKMNRRYEDARDLLLLAYERRPGGRTICYSLCELSIKMEEFVEAVEYYKEFVQVAPKDHGRYVLQYKLYEAQDVSLEERIAVLEELKKRDYREKWAYELAYLYHRIGLAARCVEECDELILWFGDGKYVIKAMELKMLHQPLTADQQAKYDRRFVPSVQEIAVENEAEAQQEQSVNEDILLQKTIVVNTEEVQAAIAQGIDTVTSDTVVYTPVGYQEETPAEDELDIHVQTMDVSQYNTINLQAEIAAGLREILGQEQQVIEDPITRSIMAPMMESDTESLDYPEIDEVSEDDLETETGEMESSEVFFGETGEMKDITAEMVLAQMRREAVQESASAEEVAEEVVSSELEMPGTEEELFVEEEPAAELVQNVAEPAFAEELPQEQNAEEQPQVADVSKITFVDTILRAEPPKELAKVLSQGADGQLSLVIPENERVEKQITGQISIDDILIEWERIKKENQEKRENQVRQHVLEHTGNLFTEFELSVRDGLLEQLEREKIDGQELAEVVEEVTEEEVAEIAEEAIEEEVAEITEEAIEEEITELAEEVIEEEITELAEEVIEEEVAEVAEEVIEEEITELAEEVIEEAVAEVAEEITEEVICEEDEVEELEEIADPETLEEETPDTEESAEAEAIPEQPAPKEEIIRERPKLRALTKEEKMLYAPYIQTKSAKEQLINAIDHISMAAYTGNLIITGEKGMDTLALAKNMMKELQVSDSNFSGKVAKITGAALNKKDVAEVLGKLKNGALIVAGASDINSEIAQSLHKALQQETYGIVVVLEDSRKAMDRFLEENAQLYDNFTTRVDVTALSNDALVAFGKHYAREREYSIDDFGILALHTRIEELQTLDHAVTVMDVKELVDEAIDHANRKNLKHFFDILMGKRYDEEDMIVLGEKDFA